MALVSPLLTSSHSRVAMAAKSRAPIVATITASKRWEYEMVVTSLTSKRWAYEMVMTALTALALAMVAVVMTTK
eukprot:2879653-Pleurochrysis_carterae.AAC.1